MTVAFVSLLAAITAGAWFNQRGLERQMEAFRQEIKAEFAAMRTESKAEFAAIRTEIQAVNQRVAALESRVEPIERQLDQIFKPVLPEAGD